MAGPSGSLSAALASVSLQVNRDNVLQARKAVLDEAQRLQDLLITHQRDVWVDLCGGDPVSADAAEAFNERIHQLVDHCWRYAMELKAAGDALGETARAYGFTDEQIAASYR